MNRTRRLALLAPVVLLAVSAAAGCDLIGGQPTANASSLPATPSATDATSTPTTTASPTPTSTAPAPAHFTTDGAGPYVMGRTAAQLQPQPGLDQIGPMEGCPGNTTARGTGVWKDIYLSFRPDGRLYLLQNRSVAIPTPSGIYLGFTRDQVKSVYSGLVVFELSHDGTDAVLVQTLGGGGILFELNANDQVTSMYSGQSLYLRSTFTAGGPFC